MYPNADQKNADIGSGIPASLIEPNGVFQNHVYTTAITVLRHPSGDVKLSISDARSQSDVLLSAKEAAHLATLLSPN